MKKKTSTNVLLDTLEICLVGERKRINDFKLIGFIVLYISHLFLIISLFYSLSIFFNQIYLISYFRFIISIFIRPIFFFFTKQEIKSTFFSFKIINLFFSCIKMCNFALKLNLQKKKKILTKL